MGYTNNTTPRSDLPASYGPGEFQRPQCDEVGNLVADGIVTPNKTCTPDALYHAAAWVEAYETDDLGEAQELADAAAAIVRLADSMRKRRALAAAKREYAAEHGVPVSSVRVKR